MEGNENKTNLENMLCPTGYSSIVDYVENIYHVVAFSIGERKKTLRTRYVFVGKGRNSINFLKSYESSGRKAPSSSQKKTLAKEFGDDFETKLGLNVSKKMELVFVEDSIYLDDTLDAVYHKILSLITATDLYLWIKRKIVDREGFDIAFLRNLFQDRLLISIHELEQTLLNVAGLEVDFQSEDEMADFETAKTLMEGFSLKTVLEPLRFKYYQNNSLVYFPIDPTLVESFDAMYVNHHFDLIDEKTHTVEQHPPYKNTFHAASSSFLSKMKAPSNLYLPKTMEYRTDLQMVLSKHVESMSLLMGGIHEKARNLTPFESYDVHCGLQTIQFRVNEGVEHNTSHIDLANMFADFSPDELCPFVKYASLDGIIYKLDKRALVEDGNLSKVHLQLWTKSDQTLATRKNEFIAFRVYIGKPHVIPYYATVILYNNIMYDVRFQFSIQDNISYKFVVDASLKVNALVNRINNMLKLTMPHLDLSIIKTTNMDSFTKFVRSSTVATIRLDAGIKNVDTSNIIKIIDQYAPCFTIIGSNKAGIHLAYTRVSDFTSGENISLFVKRNMNIIQNKERLSQHVSIVFGIPGEIALEFVNHARSDLGDDRGFGFNRVNQNTKQKNITIVNIKLVPTSIGYKVTMDGLTSPSYNKRILSYLTVLLHHAQSPGGKKAKLDKNKTILYNLASDIVFDGKKNKKSGGDDESGDMDDFIDDDVEYDDDDMEEVMKLLNDAENNKKITKSSPSSGSSSDLASHKGDSEDSSDPKRKSPAEAVPHDFPIRRFVFDPEAPDRKQDKNKIKESEFTESEDESDSNGGKKTKGRKKKSKEMLDELYKADPNLFKQPSGKTDNAEKNNYATSCQMTHKHMPRQPVVVRPSELMRIKKKYPGSVRNWIAYGSTPDMSKKNVYFCPDLWCPKSRVAMTFEQFKKAKKKCPTENEKPVKYYKSTYFFGKNIYVGLMQHPDKTSFHNNCVPCCFIRPPKAKDQKCPLNDIKMKADVLGENAKEGEEHVGDQNEKERYIMKDKMFPLLKGRYGLLPPALAKFLGNRNGTAGSGTDGAGHMSKNTNCFLRYGIHYKKQAFLECIASVLNNDALRTDVDILNAIKKNITVQDFVVIQGGLLMRRFITHNGDAVKNQLEYNKFKAWFLSQTDYVEKFGLSHIHDVLWTHTQYSGNMPNAMQVMREYVIYKAFAKFHTYLDDDRIIKTHEVLLHLILKQTSWMNTSGSNIIIFDIQTNNQVILSCYPHKPVEQVIQMGKPFILITKRGNIYEPIHHTRVDGASLKSRFRFDIYKDKAVAKTVEYMKLSCKQGKSSKKYAKLMAELVVYLQKEGYTLEKQVIDYNMNIIGLVLTGNLYIPIPFHCLFDDSMFDKNGIQCVFIDTLYSIIRPDVKLVTKASVSKLLDDINLFLKGDYYEIPADGDSRKWLVVNLPKHKTIPSQLVPLVPPTGWQDQQASASYINDLQIFVRAVSNDPRKDYVDASRTIENMYLAVRNQLVHSIRHVGDKAIVKEVEFLRHPKNPMPMDMKRKHLYDMLNVPVIKEFIHKSKGGVIPGVSNDVFKDVLCSDIADKTECNAQCSWIVTTLNGKAHTQSCKLRVPDNIFMMVVSRALNDLVNPYFKMHIAQMEIQTDQDDNVIMFTESDVLSGKFNEIIDNASDQDVRYLGIEKRREGLLVNVYNDIQIKQSTDAVETILASGEETNVHSDYRNLLKGFKAIKLSKYTNNSLYDFFAALYNRIHTTAQVSSDALKAIVKKLVLADFKTKQKTTLLLLESNRIFTARDYTEKYLEEWYNGKRGIVYPGKLEIKKLAEFTGVDVMLFERKTKNYPDTLRCLTKEQQRPTFFIMLQQLKHDKEKHFERYDIIVDKEGKYLFESIDINAEFRKVLTLKCKTYKVAKQN
jgi:hypothetical protein